MGIGYVAVGNNIYDGKAVVGATALEIGEFVDLTFASNKWTAASGADYLVCNEDDQVEPGASSTKDITLATGTYVKLKKLLPGEKFVTSKAATLAIGDSCSVSAGALIAGTSGKHASVVIDKFKVDGVDCYLCEVVGGEGDYTLPTASATTLGGVKIGTGLTISDGVVSVG